MFLTLNCFYVYDYARIDPGYAFRLIVKSKKYKANLDYGIMEKPKQQHEMWVDTSSGYNLDKFIEDVASKIIWGNSQTLSVWAVDSDSAAEWKLRRNEHFKQMIQGRLNDRLAYLVVEVVDKVGYQPLYSSARSKATMM